MAGITSAVPKTINSTSNFLRENVSFHWSVVVTGQGLFALNPVRNTLKTIGDAMNASRYYREKHKQENLFWEGALAIIKKYDLDVQLEDEWHDEYLTDDEYAELLAARGDNIRMDKLKAKVKERLDKKYKSVFLINNMHWYLGTPDRRITILHYGLFKYNRYAAEAVARINTGYGWDLLSDSQKAGYIAAFAASLVVGFFTSGLSTAAVLGMVAGAIAGVLNDLLNTINRELNNVYSARIVNMDMAAKYLAQRMDKKLDKHAGNITLKQDLRAYPYNDLYDLTKAGGERFTPSKAHNPTSFMTKTDMPNPFKGTDANTQGRDHFYGAGNAGYMNKLNPISGVEKIQEVQPDIEYKINWLNNKSAWILEGVANLNNYGISTKASDRASWQAFVQKVYDWNFGKFEKQFLIYTQSKFFEQEMSTYPHALRFRGDFFSYAEYERSKVKLTPEFKQRYLEKLKESIVDAALKLDPVETLENYVFERLQTKYEHLDDEVKWLTIDCVVRNQTAEYWEACESVFVDLPDMSGVSQSLRNKLLQDMDNVNRYDGRWQLMARKDFLIVKATELIGLKLTNKIADSLDTTKTADVNLINWASFYSAYFKHTDADFKRVFDATPHIYERTGGYPIMYWGGYIMYDEYTYRNYIPTNVGYEDRPGRKYTINKVFDTFEATANNFAQKKRTAKSVSEYDIYAEIDDESA